MDSLLRDRIRSFVELHAEEQLEFVVDLCNQNSYTYNRSGTGKVAEMVLARLKGLLPVHRAVSQPEVGDHHILRTREAARATYLLGHLDTVFPPDHPFQHCRRDGDWLVGPGTGDMKGGLAIVVYALKALAAADALGGLNLTMILGADEEIGSPTAQPIYEAERENAIACIVTECAGSGGEIVVSRNGKAGARLDCSGADSHVGRTGDAKASAILEIAHKIVALEALNGCYPGVTVNVGTVSGGLGPSTVPARASCLFDLRWRDEEHRAALIEEVHRVARQVAQPGSSCETAWLNSRPAMPLTDATRGMLATLRRVAEIAGIPVPSEHRRGTSDANYFGAAGVPTLDGLGPVCEDDHTPKERILIPSLASRTILLALLLVELRSSE